MKYRNRIFAITFLGAALALVQGCNSSEDETSTVGNWTRTTPFKGRPRSGAIAFTIGDKAFVGLGYDGDEYLPDFYVYDVNSGYWESQQSFPGILRERAVAFSINGKGYVGLGYNRDLDEEELADFWEYDPAAQEGAQWKQVASFEGTARYNAIGFALGARGYVGTGYDGDNYNSDFWSYDPVSNDWEEIKSYPGEKIEGGLAFVIGSKAYICTGRNNGLHTNDFWEFDPETINWTKRTPDDEEAYYDDFKLAVQRHDAVALTINNKAYLTGGIAASGAVVRTVYEFDPSSLAWDERTSFEGSARSMAVAFVIGNDAFVGTGQNGTSRFDDLWQFKPDELYDEND
ncbi:MAG TPA: kelch repeat-containing protein [Ohtaekwangia sp.]|nr:kelch repeat-containing protein [Ohtaekwangia sp.]